MRLDTQGYPVIILSHRKRAFIERTVDYLRHNVTGVTDVIVVDDSGDPDHHDWLDHSGLQYSLSSPNGSNVGYLGGMQTVWETAREAAGVLSYALLWEEDFMLTHKVDMFDLATIMNEHPTLAQLNLQRQSVYRVERRLGYLESHQHRGYGLRRQNTAGLPWVSRRTPFTTNPGLIRTDVLDIDWPGREQAGDDAEAAMSKVLESEGWDFGWYGQWNRRAVTHVGTERKTGKGY